MKKIKGYFWTSAIIFMITVSYYPSFRIIIKKWSTSDDYTHAFLTVPVIIYMIWLKRGLLVDGKGQSFLGLSLVVFSCLFYVVSLVLQIPTIIFLATAMTLTSILIYYGGLHVLREMAIPIALLFMLIPIPNQVLSLVTGALQLKISHWSELIVQAFSIPIFREGNVLNIPDKTFQVVEACSGVRSLISLTTLSLIIGFFTLNTCLAVLLLLLFSIPIAIIVNIIRVVSLVVAYHFYQIDLTVGVAHTMMGLVLFGFGLAILFIFQRILASWESKK